MRFGAGMLLPSPLRHPHPDIACIEIIAFLGRRPPIGVLYMACQPVWKVEGIDAFRFNLHVGMVIFDNLRSVITG